MNKISLYLNDRFPIIPVLLFAFGYGALGVGLSIDNIRINYAYALRTLILFSFVFLFFLLRQRVTDEFKDAEHDKRNFPDRPVPRGLISKKDLVLLGIFALVFEFICVLLLGKNFLLIYFSVFLYSLLMAKEFFAGDWLNKHFNIYLFSHELIFILFGIFFISINNYENNPLILLIKVLILFTAPVSIEVIRKFSPRTNKEGVPVADTYTTVWGRGKTIFILIFLNLLCSLFLTVVKDSYIFILFGLLISAVILFGRKSDKVITTFGALNFLGLAILANIIWKS